MRIKKLRGNSNRIAPCCNEWLLLGTTPTTTRVVVVLLGLLVTAVTVYLTGPSDAAGLHTLLLFSNDMTKTTKDPCHSSNFRRVQTPLFIRWEEWNSFVNDKPTAAPPHDWYIIQLGGNVGLNIGGGDPVWEYVRPCHWQGAILEPQPDVFAQLQANYADVAPRIQTLPWAISNQQGNFSMRGGGEQAGINIRQPGNISVHTLQDLWNYLQPPMVHALVVDVEGHEERILYYQDIPSPKPRLILFERKHLTTFQLDRIDLGLKRQGYEFQTDLRHEDDLARRSNAPPQDRLYALVVDEKARS